MVLFSAVTIITPVVKDTSLVQQLQIPTLAVPSIPKELPSLPKQLPSMPKLDGFSTPSIDSLGLPSIPKELPSLPTKTPPMPKLGGLSVPSLDNLALPSLPKELQDHSKVRRRSPLRGAGCETKQQLATRHREGPANLVSLNTATLHYLSP